MNESNQYAECTPFLFRGRVGDGVFSFDAWGRRRDKDDWSYTLSGEPALFADRGFTGHEHLTEFGLINMNGRLYDPLVGRFLSPDNYVQSPGYTQSFNRYSYCWNNPLKYTDPDGEIVFLAACHFLYFTETGYEVQKYISPFAFHVSIHSGTDQKGLGFDFSYGLPKITAVSYRKHFGSTYYWNYFDDSYSGWEHRNGAEWTALGYFNYSGTTYKSGEISQTNGMFTFGNPFVNLKYENDNFFGFKLPFVPETDGGDRYRTAAARLKIGSLSFGINLFTGDPGLEGGTRKVNYDLGGKFGQYEINDFGDDPDKYRAGIAYIGFGRLKIGRNSEAIRNYIQNEKVHDNPMVHSPYFKVLNRPSKWYFYFGTGTGNSLW